MSNLRPAVIVAILFAVLLSAFGAERYQPCGMSGNPCIAKRPLLSLLLLPLLPLPPLFVGFAEQGRR